MLEVDIAEVDAEEGGGYEETICGCGRQTWPTKVVSRDRMSTPTTRPKMRLPTQRNKVCMRWIVCETMRRSAGSVLVRSCSSEGEGEVEVKIAVQRCTRRWSRVVRKGVISVYDRVTRLENCGGRFMHKRISQLVCGACTVQVQIRICHCRSHQTPQCIHTHSYLQG